MRPSIISISHQPGRGLVAVGRFACGHTEVNVFPQAARRTSPRELATWMFGPRLDERCARCERRARSTPPDAVCICAGRRPGDLAADDCPALVHVGRAEAWAHVADRDVRPVWPLVRVQPELRPEHPSA